MGGGVSSVGDIPSFPQQRQNVIQESIDGDPDTILSPTAPLAIIRSLKSQEIKVRLMKIKHVFTDFCLISDLLSGENLQVTS
jgi:hypothetical protein